MCSQINVFWAQLSLPWLNTRPSALALILLGFLNASTVDAAGVAAGTVIQNTASATYSSGTKSQTLNSNTLKLRVDEMLDVTVDTLDASARPLGSDATVLSFNVTNTGNGAEAFRLTTDPAVSGNGFVVVVKTVAVDTNGNGAFDPDDLVIAAGGNTPQIAPDASLTVFVVVSMQGDAPENASSQVRLTATATTGSGTPGTVFAGQGAGGGDAVVGSTAAQDYGLGVLNFLKASVSLIKSYSISDPFGGTQPVPGAIITYNIRADVAGANDISGLRVTDVIPTGTTYVGGTLTLDGVELTDAVDGDAGTASAAGIAVEIGRQNGGTSHSVTFRTRIN